MTLAGKAIVVTGAGSGLGRALAVECAARRARVVCAGRRAVPLRETVELIRARGGLAAAVAADVTDGHNVERLFREALERFGGPHVLVNNAGSFGAMGALWNVDPDLWWRDVEINLKGVMLCTRAALLAMRPGNAGVVLNLSGGGAESPNSGGSAYGSSKAAVVRLTETVARELAKDGSGIFVMAIDPGFNRTAMTERLAGMPDSARWHAHVHRLPRTTPDSSVADFTRTAIALIERARPEWSGRLFHVTDDLAALEEKAADLAEKNLLVLRLRKE